MSPQAIALPDEAVAVDAIELMRHVSPAYGVTWRGAVTGLLSDRHEASVIRVLATELRRDGAFVEPVVVDPEDLVVANGMHRIVAAAFCGIGLAVTTVFPDGEPAAAWEVRWMVSGGDLWDDLVAESWSALRSFPTPHGWVQTDHLGAQNGVCYGIWDWDGEPQTLCGLLATRAAQSGLSITIVDAAPYDWNE